MKIIKVGISPQEKIRERVLAIAKGERKPNLSSSTLSNACARQSWMRVCAPCSMTSLGTRSLFWRLSRDGAGSKFNQSLIRYLITLH